MNRPWNFLPFPGNRCSLIVPRWYHHGTIMVPSWCNQSHIQMAIVGECWRWQLSPHTTDGPRWRWQPSPHTTDGPRWRWQPSPHTTDGPLMAMTAESSHHWWATNGEFWILIHHWWRSESRVIADHVTISYKYTAQQSKHSFHCYILTDYAEKRSK